MSNKRKFEFTNTKDNILNNPEFIKLIKNFNKELIEFVLSDEIDHYINYERIEDELNCNNSNIYNIIKNNIRGEKNRCLECNQDIGECNPRQLCAKTYCENNYENFISIESESKLTCSICSKQHYHNSIVKFNTDISICNNCIIEKSCIR